MQCRGYTRRGYPCSRNAASGDFFCYQHQPEARDPWATASEPWGTGQPEPWPPRPPCTDHNWQMTHTEEMGDGFAVFIEMRCPVCAEVQWSMAVRKKRRAM